MDEQAVPSSGGMDYALYAAERKAMIDAALDTRLPAAASEPRQVHEAMRFAVFGPGKRLRPLLSLAVADLVGEKPERLLDAACGIEFAHTASLILDDLPCMDDAATRRGRPCAHRQFGEATALLAAMALLSSAFDLVSKNALAFGGGARLVREAVRVLAQSVGAQGLVHGQHLDISFTGQRSSFETLERVHQLKAGALFLAALKIPAEVMAFPESDIQALERYGSRLGMAFQVTDDLLDEKMPSEDAGKTTFTTHLGRDGARERAHSLITEALEALASFGARAGPLRLLAEYVRRRSV